MDHRVGESIITAVRGDGREDHKQSFMWIARGGPPEKPVVRYLYLPSRSGSIARSYLTGYRGYLQTDAYDGYTQIGEWEGIVHVGCLAHARRKFDEAVKDGSSAAREFIALIGKIYRVEKELRRKDLSDEQFVALRARQTDPLLEQLEKKLEKKTAQVPPSTALGRAVNYTREVLTRIKRYLEPACLTPDNNAAERAIRPFVIGRKNCLFSDTPKGDHASAAFYSLIESAKSAYRVQWRDTKKRKLEDRLNDKKTHGHRDPRRKSETSASGKEDEPT